MVEKFLKYFYSLSRLYAFSILLDHRSTVPGLKVFLKLLKRQLGPDYSSDLEGYMNAFQEAHKLYELRYKGTARQAPIAQTSPHQPVGGCSTNRVSQRTSILQA